MACLALSLQPSNGADILLQTREWFPPARALAALSSFRQTRLAYGRAHAGDDADDSLGDDPLAAAGGQLLVGVDRQYRVVYRLVNSIYVLGITTAQDNVFDCISTVNQAVSVLVAACRGVDVMPEKLQRKYAEVYMALDVVLRGVSSIRLASMLSSIHADSIAKMLHTAVESENKVRGAETWATVEPATVSHQANVELFEETVFELPLETLAAGDELAATLVPSAPPEQADAQAAQKVAEEPGAAAEDPFAASDALNKPVELVGGFVKSKEAGGPSADISTALAGLEVTSLPPAAASQSTFISVEGFEGDYGGVEYGNEASLSETFEGFDDAFGGGLDASEFVGPSKVKKPDLRITELELLNTEQGAKAAAAAAAPDAPLENLLVTKTAERKGPELYVVEEISAEFRESLLTRVGLRGVVYLKTMAPPKDSPTNETDFSFKLDGTAGIKRCVMESSHVSSLGNGLFHIRSPHMENPVAVVKYSLQPRFVPIPLRVRLINRLSGSFLSVMLQYASNPDLPAPLTDVEIVLKLPVDPTLLNVSPRAVLFRAEKELRWHIDEVHVKGPPGKLRARMSVDLDDPDFDKDFEMVATVKFSHDGVSTLSGISLQQVSDDKKDFYQTNHRYVSGTYICC